MGNPWHACQTWHANDLFLARITEFKEYWTEKVGMIKKDNKALCILCSETVVCRTSSVKRHFESVHKNLSNKTEEEQRELISRELSKTKKNRLKLL